MKVILLAADSNESLNGGQLTPRCLAPIKGGVTILDRQLRMLSLYGVSRSDITIVIGGSGVWENESFKSEINKYGCNICVNLKNANTGSAYSLFLALLDEVCEHESYLVISANMIFDISHLEVLINDSYKDALLARRALLVGESGIYLNVDSQLLAKSASKKMSEIYPWYIYSGMTILTRDRVNSYKKQWNDNAKMSYIEVLLDIISDSIKVIDYTSPKGGEKDASKTLMDLTGGSFANLRKRHIVRKMAGADGSEKLINEVKWLLRLPESIKTFFPLVVDYKFDKNDAWFDMPWYNFNNLRKNILIGDYNETKVLLILEKILDFVFDNLYSNVIGKTPDNWVREKHFKRVHDRLAQCYEQAPVVKLLMSANTLNINGIEYRNLPELLSIMGSNDDVDIFFTPDCMRMIHGDLHFQNMLINEIDNTFILADPRGELEGSDIYYDLGKLWHSFNGQYDLIHTDQYNLSYSNDGEGCIFAQVELGTKSIRDVYAQVKKLVEEKLQGYELVSNDPNWKLKAKFSEAMHFSSVIPFHLFGDNEEKRAVVLYLAAVQLMNELFDNLKQHIEFKGTEKQQSVDLIYGNGVDGSNKDSTL